MSPKVITSRGSERKEYIIRTLQGDEARKGKKKVDSKEYRTWRVNS